MRCSNCNNEISDNSKSCIFCATTSSSLPEDEDISIEQAPPRPSSTNAPTGTTILLSFIGGVLLAGLSLGGYMLLNGKDGDGLNNLSQETLELKKSDEVISDQDLTQSQPSVDVNIVPAQTVDPTVREDLVSRKEVTVNEPMLDAFIIPSKMDVVYRGVDNHISIIVPGYSSADIQPTISNGQIQKVENGWVVRPGKGNVVSISVSTSSSNSTPSKEVKLRVKEVPDPKPAFGVKTAVDETIAKGELIEVEGVFARLDGFEFNFTYEIIEYRVTMIVGGTPLEQVVRGSMVSSAVREMFGKAKPGQKVYIEGIKAKGTDGTVRSLGTLAFKVT